MGGRFAPHAVGHVLGPDQHFLAGSRREVQFNLQAVDVGSPCCPSSAGGRPLGRKQHCGHHEQALFWRQGGHPLNDIMADWIQDHNRCFGSALRSLEDTTQPLSSAAAPMGLRAALSLSAAKTTFRTCRNRTGLTKT